MALGSAYLETLFLEKWFILSIPQHWEQKVLSTKSQVTREATILAGGLFLIINSKKLNRNECMHGTQRVSGIPFSTHMNTGKS